MTSRPSRAARDSMDADQSTQSASSVTTSRITSLSTSVGIGLRSAARQLHDLVGGQPGGGRPAHARNDGGATSVCFPGFPDSDGIAVQLELHLRLREQTEGFAERLRDGDLAFVCQPHGYYSYE